jgi:hypothetical protein
MMNVLQRKMFAEGDVANTSVSEPLIRYYVSQGYNPAEIKAAYPAAPYGLIEQIAMEFGGVVNPGVQGRNSTGYTEDMPQAVTEGQFGSLLNQVPMNETIVTGSPTGNLQPGQISPPSMPIQDDIQMSLGELNDPRFDAVIQGNYMGIPTPEVAGNIDQNLSNDLLNQKIQNLITKRNSLIAELGFPSGEIPELQMLDQEIASLRAQLPSNATAPSLDQQIADLSSAPAVNTTVDIETGLPTEREISVSSSGTLKPNQYRASNGNIYNIDPSTFAGRMRNENSRVLQGYIYNPYVEYGDNLKKIIEDEAYQRQSTISGATTSIDEARNESPQALNFGGAFQSMFEGAKDIGLEGAEKIVDFGRAALPGLAGIFQGRRQELAAREKLGQPFEIETGMGDPAYNRLGGETKENLDQFILESSIGQVSDPIQNSINDANKTDAAVVDAGKKSTEVVTDKTATEAEEKTTEGLDFSKYAPDLQERLDAELSDTSRITGQPTEQEQENINRIITNQGSFFSSPDWNEFLRNLGLGLSGSADLASGLVKGTALGSQAKALREAEALEAEQEERLEKIKAGAEDSLKPTDIVSLNKMTSEMSTNIKDFEGSRASIGIMNDAISLFEEAMSKGVKITGLQGKISRFTDQGKAFFNIDGEVSDSTKIQNYIDQVKQRSIRDILNESGRTISNLDREIVDKVFGEINLTDEPKEILKKLRRARSNLMDSNADKQRVIGTNYSSITNKAYGATGLRTIAPYEVMVQQILNANPSSFGSMQPIQGAVNVDLRGQNIFGNN